MGLSNCRRTVGSAKSGHCSFLTVRSMRAVVLWASTPAAAGTQMVLKSEEPVIHNGQVLQDDRGRPLMRRTYTPTRGSAAAWIRLAKLLEELKTEGPAQAEWSHYGQLFGQKGQKPGERRYHCHLQGGRQTMLACWRVWRDTLIVEVYYVGSHGKAPYSRIP